MQLSNLNEREKSLQFSKFKPKSLHSLKLISRNAVLISLTILRLQPMNSQLVNWYPEKSWLEKSQFRNLQLSYSPFNKPRSLTSSLVKVLSYISCILCISVENLVSYMAYLSYKLKFEANCFSHCFVRPVYRGNLL